jgi:hypothetical protein
MSKVCARCGAESRDEARICVGCGGSNFKLTSKLRRPPLVVPCPSCKRLNRPGTQLCAKCGTDLLSAAAMTGPAPLPAAAPRSPEPDAERQVAEPVELPDWVHAPASLPRSGIVIAATAVAAIVVAAAAWFAISGGASESDADFDADVTAPPSAATPPAEQPGASAAAAGGLPSDAGQAGLRARSTPSAATAGAPPNAGESARARQVREKQEREARARTALEQQRAAEQERAQVDAAAQQAAAAPSPAAVPAPPAAPPTPPQTVGQLCSGRNPITEQICQVRECRNSSNAGDPICIRFKELEQSGNRPVDR